MPSTLTRLARAAFLLPLLASSAATAAACVERLKSAGIESLRYHDRYAAGLRRVA